MKKKKKNSLKTHKVCTSIYENYTIPKRPIKTIIYYLVYVQYNVNQMKLIQLIKTSKKL